MSVGTTKKSMYREAVDLIGLTMGIYVCYLTYGIVQEGIYKQEFEDGSKFKFSLFLVGCQCTVNCFVACIITAIVGAPPNKVPHTEYAKIACSYIGAMFSSNFALNYVSYPTQALAKACKMIPVMLSNTFINKTVYKPREYATVFLITAGIAWFMLSKDNSGKSGGSTSLLGLALLFTSLAMDGYTGPTQQFLKSKYEPTSDQLMVWLNVYAVIICSVFLVAGGELFEAIAFLTEHPSLLKQIAMFCCLSAAGQKVVMMTLFRFDSLVLTMITTTRKFFTILASVVVHGSVLNENQWIGVGMVFAGVCADVYFKYERKKAAQDKATN